MDTDVVDTDVVTDKEWMRLNEIIQRIDSDVDEQPSTKRETPPALVVYVPQPVPIPIPVPITQIHHVPLFIPYCVRQQPWAGIPHPMSKENCKQKDICKQNTDRGDVTIQKPIRKQKNGERGKDKNSALQTAKSDVEDHVAEEQCKPLLNICAEATHKVPNVVGGTADGTLTKPNKKRNKKRSRGERGRDISARAPRCCGLCRAMSPGTRYNCKGRGGMKHCEYWNLDKSRKMIQ